jgi:GntR family transcriptional regulator, trigonelline degradation regulator
MEQGSQETAMRSRRLRIERPPPTLREMALVRLRGAILDFHFKPGERLVEREVCSQLGVSRSVVREVIRHLESEGLVHTVPHQGPIVARLDAETAVQIYELRDLLEGAAAEAAASKATPQDIARMEQALSAIDKAYARKDHRGVLSATTTFYEVMFGCAGKTVAWEVVQRLNGRISWLRAMTISSRGRSKSGPSQMRKMLKAIRASDGKAAAAACREHLRSAGKIAQELLSESRAGGEHPLLSQQYFKRACACAGPSAAGPRARPRG